MGPLLRLSSITSLLELIGENLQFRHLRTLHLFLFEPDNPALV